MTLTHQGVEFTVIGTIGKVERWSGGHRPLGGTPGVSRPTPWLRLADLGSTGISPSRARLRDFDVGAGGGGPLRRWRAAETPPWRVYRGENYKYYRDLHLRDRVPRGRVQLGSRDGRDHDRGDAGGPCRDVEPRRWQDREGGRTDHLLPPSTRWRANWGGDLPAAAEPRPPAVPLHALTPKRALPRACWAGPPWWPSCWPLLSAVISGPADVFWISQERDRLASRRSVSLSKSSNASQISRGLALRHRRHQRLGRDRDADHSAPAARRWSRASDWFNTTPAAIPTEPGPRVVALRPPALQARSHRAHQITSCATDGAGGNRISVQIDEGKVTFFWLLVVGGAVPS